MATFRFAPDILRRLGEELNPSLEHGVIELVKNARDADARNCEVRLSDVTAPGGAIFVSDDGDGMTAEELVD
ncbi:MAG: ATP-binding protein, partial [Acidimicrobiaceae bacterium]|nr:ATP-binding protein [Acidimicrobiaceae bacterium]